MLTTLGYAALILGIVLIVVGYTVEARALRPGWGCIILALVLILLGVLLPHHTYGYDTTPDTTRDAAGATLLPRG
jgi:uncharacterized membrane protein